MSNSCTRALSYLLNFHPFHRDDFIISDLRFQESKFVRDFFIGSFSSEKVNTIKDIVTQPSDMSFKWIYLLSHLNATTSGLIEGLKLLIFKCKSTPIIILKIKVQNFITNCTIFKHSSVYDQRMPKYSCTMVFSWLYRNSFSSQYIILGLSSIINKNLRSAFSNLPLSIEHEAASKNINFIIVSSGLMSASTFNLHFLVLRIIDILPNCIISCNFHLSYFIVGFKVEATNKIAALVAISKSTVFSRSWHPVVMLHILKFSIK